MPETGSHSDFTVEDEPISQLVGRGLVGGLFMGLANLVPGISGGTMLLAAGVYPAFIRAVAEVTTLRFRTRSVVVLGSVVAAAGVAILLLAGLVGDLVIHHRWAMYSLFIGLTLGGVPVVRELAGPINRPQLLGALGGFLGMAALAVVQSLGLGTGVGGAAGIPMMFVAGVAGASAMILPGVSGGYLLLVLGVYVPILRGIDQFKEALKGLDPSGALEVTIAVIAPVGIGVVVGVAVVSNLLERLLERFRDATLGMLLGLLIGAVVGLWPFQAGVQPEPGDVVKGQIMTEASLADLDVEDWPTRFFRPSPGQAAGSLGLLGLGLATTLLVTRFGRRTARHEFASDDETS